MAAIKNDRTAGGRKRKKPTGSITGTVREHGPKKLLKDKLRINKRGQGIPAFRTDSVPDVKYLPLKEKKGTTATNWMSDFLHILEIRGSLLDNKLKIYKALKSFSNLNDFLIEKNDSLVSVMKKCYEMLKSGYQFIPAEEEVALTEESFSADNYAVCICLRDINTIETSDRKLGMAMRLLLRYLVSRKEFALKTSGAISWEIEQAKEEYAYMGNDQKNFVESHNNFVYIKTFMDPLIHNKSLLYKREYLLSKLCENGYFNQYGLTEAVKDILNNSLDLSPYQKSNFSDHKYSIYPKELQDDYPLVAEDLFCVEGYRPWDSDDHYYQEANERVGNYGCMVYYNVYGSEAVFEDHGSRVFYDACSKISEFIYNHEANKSNYDIPDTK